MLSLSIVLLSPVSTKSQMVSKFTPRPPKICRINKPPLPRSRRGILASSSEIIRNRKSRTVGGGFNVFKSPLVGGRPWRNDFGVILHANRTDFKPDLPGSIRAVTDACTRAIQRLNSKITQNEVITSHYLVKSNISQTSHVSVLPGGGLLFWGGFIVYI